MPIPSPFCRSLSDSFVKSSPTVAWPVISTVKPPCPSAPSTAAITGLILSGASFSSLPGMVT